MIKDATRLGRRPFCCPLRFLGELSETILQGRYKKGAASSARPSYVSDGWEEKKKIFEERERLEQIYKKSLLDGDNIHNEQINQAQNTFNKKYEEVNVQNNNLIDENETLTKK